MDKSKSLHSLTCSEWMSLTLSKQAAAAYDDDDDLDWTFMKLWK